MSIISDENLLHEFIAESKEHLQSIEPALLALEKDGANADKDVINQIFRAIHSIKGAAGFFGFESLKRLSHVMESVFMLVREGPLVPTPDVVDVLLQGVDLLTQMIDDVHQSETVPCDEVMAQLHSIQTNGCVLPKANAGSSTSDASAGVNAGMAEKMNALPKIEFNASVPFQPDRLAVINALSDGKSLYEILMLVEKDIFDRGKTPLKILDEFETMGVLLDTLFDPVSFAGLDECLEAPIPIKFLFASVLEPLLLAQALSIPESQVVQLDFMHVLEPDKQEPMMAPPPSTASNAQSSVPSSSASEQGKQGSVAPANKGESMSKDVEVQHPMNPTSSPSTVASGGEAIESVRVKVDLLNRLMNLAGEMVLLRNQLMRTLEDESSKIPGLPNILQNLDLTTTDLQEHIMQTRMQPIGSIFGKFPRVVRDLSRQLGKEIQLDVVGDEVELDKSIIEGLSDPLTHLIRNCCDHGLETPEVRQSLGKSKTGHISLMAYHEGGQINIAIVDDGKGIDADVIVQKALDSKAITQAEVDKMSHAEKINLIFLPGLSTAKEITDVSGRGVGMDVVRTNIEKMGGHITIESNLGEGTTVLLRLPLTLAIIPSLIVSVEQHRFAVPQVNLVELICVKANEVSRRIEQVGSATVLRLRGKLLPLVRLADVLDISRYYRDPTSGKLRRDRRTHIANQQADETKVSSMTLAETGETAANIDMFERREHPQSDYYVIVVQVGNNQYGLIVDMVHDLEEIVVKPLSMYLNTCQCFSGATIMGDGRVAMILDVSGTASFAKLSFSEAKAAEERMKLDAQKREQERSDLLKMDVILFGNGNGDVFAVPLCSVLRLEKMELSKIEVLGNQEYLTYRGKGLPLIRLENLLPLHPMAQNSDDAYLIIPKSGDCAAGILAAEILDTLSVEVSLQEVYGGRAPGVHGAAVVQGKLTVFIDPDGLMDASGIHYQKNTREMAMI